MTLQDNPNLVDSGFDNPPENPITLMKKWFSNAESVGVKEPYGFCLSTVSKDGVPSSRVLLMKECDDLGIVFACTAGSRKGQEFTNNPMISANFWWRETIQQINISGRVVRLSDECSDSVFAGRVSSAQAIATLSSQSNPMYDEEKLRQDVQNLVESDESIKRPEKWGAFRLEPDEIEFWQGSPDRFHKRLQYKRQDDGAWSMARLQP